MADTYTLSHRGNMSLFHLSILKAMLCSRSSFRFSLAASGALVASMLRLLKILLSNDSQGMRVLTCGGIRGLELALLPLYLS